MTRNRAERYSHYDGDDRFQEPSHIQGYTERSLALPEGITINSRTRIGDLERQSTITHIRQAAEQGRLSQSESDLRIQHASVAEDEVTLRTLTSDLPAPIVHVRWYRRISWSDGEIPAYFAGLILSACAAVIPGTIMDSMKLMGTPMGEAIFLPLLITGIVGFFTCLVGLLSS